MGYRGFVSIRGISWIRDDIIYGNKVFRGFGIVWKCDIAWIRDDVIYGNVVYRGFVKMLCTKTRYIVES